MNAVMQYAASLLCHPPARRLIIVFGTKVETARIREGSISAIPSGMYIGTTDLITFSEGTLATRETAYIHSPKGGVLSPIIRFITIMTPI